MTAIVNSEARVPVVQDQEVDFDMLTNIGVFAQGSIDNLIATFLGAGIGYSGCDLGTTVNAQTNSATLVTVAPGFMKRGGKVYQLRDAATLDLGPVIATIPANKTAKVVILADGQDAPIPGQITILDEAKQPADPNAYWPTKYINGDTAVVRSLIPARVAGTPDAQPEAPAYNPSFCLLGVALVDNGSVLSVTQSTGQRVTQLDTIAPLVLSLSATVASLQSLTASLLSSVSANSLAIGSLTQQFLTSITDLQRQLNALRTQTTSSSAANLRGADYFQDLSQSNPAASGYQAVIASGLRFATAIKADFSYTPSLPNVPNLQPNASPYLMPAYQPGAQARIVSPSWSAGAGLQNPLLMANLGALTAQTLQRGFGRVRTRLSSALSAGSTAQVLASGDPAQLFAIDPTTFVYDAADWGDWRTSSTEINHLAGYWQDISSKGFWTPGTPGFVQGLPVISQPFTPSAPGMLTDISIPFSSPDYVLGSAAVRVMFVADLNGRPDYANVYADTNAVSYSTGTAKEIDLSFPYPIPYKGGRKYHVLIFKLGYSITLDCVNRNEPQANTVINGSALASDYLTYVNGDWAAVAPGYTLAIGLRFATFANPTLRVPLPPLQLVGGMDLIDLLAVALVPDGCTVGYEAYIGGAWVQLGPASVQTLLSGRPGNVPVNMVLSGSATLAPIIDATVGMSTARSSRASAALDHVSAIQTPPAPVTKIHKSVIIDQWVPGVQTLTADLRTGTGYATVTQPDAAPVDAMQADGSLLRTWTWTLGAAVPTFEMELIGTTTDTTRTFIGRQTQWDAAP